MYLSLGHWGAAQQAVNTTSENDSKFLVHLTDPIFTIFVALFWLQPTPDRHLWLFSYKMFYCFHPLVTSFACLLNGTEQGDWK